MDYKNFKSNIEEIKSDLVQYPVRTICIFVLFLGLIFLYQPISSYFRKVLFEENFSNSQINGVSLYNEDIGLLTKSIVEETKDYKIDADYPIFGVPSLDMKVEGLISNQIEIFKKEKSAWTKNELYSSFDKVYIDNDIISFRLSVYQYLGGAHGGSEFFGFNYNRKTGYFYSVEDVKTLTGLSLHDLSDRVIDYLNDKFGERYFEWEGAEPKESNFSTFTLDKDKVTFVFQEYQVAPRVAGEQTFSVSRLK